MLQRIFAKIRQYGWYTAFTIKPTDKLYLPPNDRIW